MQAVDMAQSVGDLAILAEDFRRHLRSGHKSPKTIKTYLEAVEGFDRFLAGKGMPRSVAAIRREHVEAYIVDLLNASSRPPLTTATARCSSSSSGASRKAR
jgi:Phage integrase, N-terminal SAM-like domain